MSFDFSSKNVLAVLLGIFVLCSCAKPPLKTIYEPYKEKQRNPVIIVPGIKGSTLFHSDKKRQVWGGWWQVIKSDFDDLELIDPQSRSSESCDFRTFDLKSNVQAKAIFSRWRILGVFHEDLAIDIYGDLVNTLKDYGNFVDAGAKITYDKKGRLLEVDIDKKEGDLFVFYYDWRRDNALNAANLAKFIDVIKEQRYESRDVKFNIVAHSMGGLITRFYLAYHSFCKETANNKRSAYESLAELEPDSDAPEEIDKVVLLGTPNEGSMEILEAFLTGNNVETLSKKDVKRIIATMPSAYQLLPIEPLPACFKTTSPETEKEIMKWNNRYALFEPQVWKELKWSAFGPNWKEEERERDQKLQRQQMIRNGLCRAKEFLVALEKADQSKGGVSLVLMGGDCAETLQSAFIERNEKGEIVPIFDRKVILSKCDDSASKASAPEASSPTSVHRKLLKKDFYDAGDGTVTRRSMLGTSAGISANSRCLFVCQKHGSLFKDITLKDNLLYELLVRSD